MKINKKGSALDLVLAVPEIFYVCLVAVCMVFVVLTVLNLTVWDTPTSSSIVSTAETDIVPKYDLVVVSLAIGSFLIPIVLAFFIKTHPIFWVFTFISLAVGFVLTVIVSNVYQDNIQTITELSGALDIMPKTNLFFLYLPIIYFVFACLLLLFMFFVKPTGQLAEGEGGGLGL